VHNNYFFFRNLTPLIESRFNGAVVSECFSQNKDELIIRFETKNEPLFIRATLASSFSCLSFPEVFHRARKNSIDLFEQIIGRRVTGVRQFNNERSFAINLTDGFSLLFKMHGNRSNCIVIENEVITDIFIKSIETDLSLHLTTLDRDIDWSFDSFVKNKDRLETHYFTFGKVVWKYLYDHGFKTQSLNDQWTSIQHVLSLLESPVYYLAELEKITLSLLPFPTAMREFSQPIEALNYFHTEFTHKQVLYVEKAAAISRLKSILKTGETYYKKSIERLQSLQTTNNYKVWADLIMANLHVIGDRAKKVEVQNFYDDNRLVEVPLKEGLSAQKNAEIYYSKAKKQQTEVAMLQQAISKKEKEIELQKQQIDELNTISDVKALRAFVSTKGISEKSEKAESMPFHEFEFNGYKILVGKNAKSNDILTMQYSFKDDLWLHAKDVAGSHVLVKQQAGKKIPRDVIERAAQLAAYYSKRKNETLCPVVVTPKKYVRKRKGDPPGSSSGRKGRDDPGRAEGIVNGKW
jgi:predicted ribosome quality control (RQC) complex YloA/Tae2 family protein